VLCKGIADGTVGAALQHDEVGEDATHEMINGRQGGRALAGRFAWVAP
jgi:hypothetical protein